jgi:L-lactate dehydrogenase complex protein LldG
MSDARSRILQRLRSHGAQPTPQPPESTVRRFDWSPQERLQRFRECMERVRGEVHEVGADWPQRMFDLLREKGAANLLYGPDGPYGAELERGWPDVEAVRPVPYLEPVESCRDALFQVMDSGFTSCRGAIAETGSLVLWPSPEEPRLLSLVPPIHFVLLDLSEMRSTFHALMIEQSWAGSMPTNALLISGPSKSADIEQTLAYGVHGPKELIVLVRTGS